MILRDGGVQWGGHESVSSGLLFHNETMAFDACEGWSGEE